jgi:membrane fusion protein (multidrug efflux system)
VDLNPLKLSFTLPEKHAGEVKIDQIVEITASPYPGETFEGKIYFISPKIDTETRTIKIKALVDNSDFRLKPGFFINARILLEKRKSLVLPESAVLVREGKILVMAVEKDIIKYKYVITGIRFNGSVEILKGITEKDIVVTYGRNEITEGTRVTIASRK